MIRTLLVIAVALIFSMPLGAQESSAPSVYEQLMPSPLREAELPCKKRLLTVCSETADGSPICEVIRSKRQVEELGLVEFIEHMQTLSDDQARDDLVCARLMGQQRFVDFGLSYVYEPLVTRAPEIKLVVNYTDADMKKILANIAELRRIKMSQFEPKASGATVTLRGFVREVSFMRYETFIHLENVVVETIAMPEMAESGTPREWAVITSGLLKEAYQELMN